MGRSPEEMKSRAKAVLGDREHSLKEGNKSAKGTFISLHLKVLVFSHEDRHFFFEQLKADKAFIHVL